MAAILALFGVLLIVSAYKDTSKELLAQMTDDGKHFVPWLLVLVVVGAVGLNSKLRPISNAFMVLIIIALFLRSGTQIFNSFTQLKNEAST